MWRTNLFSNKTTTHSITLNIFLQEKKGEKRQRNIHQYYSTNEIRKQSNLSFQNILEKNESDERPNRKLKGKKTSFPSRY